MHELCGLWAGLWRLNAALGRIRILIPAYLAQHLDNFCSSTRIWLLNLDDYISYT
jgi:hypothetical protein